MVRPALLPLLWFACLVAVAAADEPTGLRGDVVFQHYSPLSASTELLRRLVSPLNASRIRQQAAISHAALREQPLDLANERFALYVPAHAPPNGYALLVFVPPWNEARVPPPWMPVLERHGVMLVTAAGSGNDANVLDRREPLALLGAANAMARYRVDPQRVYVGGFSGGSRVALRLALGYPDLFRGALLDAGSDALGRDIPPPPRDLLYRAQSSSRIVYLTGTRDTAREDADRVSRRSLKDACITDIDVRPMPWTGHELADASALDRALDSLDTHAAIDARALEACRARLGHDVDAQLAEVSDLIAHGDTRRARQRLDALDARYGGLAAPRSIALSNSLDGAAP